MILFATLFVTEVWAASSAAEAHPASVTQVIFPTINFLIFLYLIKRFGLPVVKNYLRSRREGIATALTEAGGGKQRAEAMLRDYRGRLQRLDEESRTIRDGLRTDGAREESKLLSEAGELATKIKVDADFLAAQEFRIAQQKVREEIARRAEATAVELVQRHLTADDQKRLVEEFLGGVGKVQ